MLQRLLSAILLSALIGGAVSAQSWPSKPIRVVIPFSAGSAVDLIGRTLFEQVDKQLGSTSIIEPRVGAGGTIAATAVAKAAPDGYTLYLASSAHTLTALTYKNLQFDAVNDFAAVSMVSTLPNVLVASPNKGYKTIQDLVAAAKAKPGSLNYASVGPATASHMNAERFRLSAGFQAQHIPFKGSPEALTEVMTGRVDFYFVPSLPALPLIADKRVVPLAIGGLKRIPQLPDIPTTIEAGYPNSDYLFWFGTLFPAKTPPEIVNRMSAEIQKALQVPSVRERLAKLGADPWLLGPQEFAALIRKELKDNAELIQAAGIKTN